MEIFGDDWSFGNFRASDYGLILASFSYNGESKDDSGLSVKIIETFIGNNPVPIYLGDKYDEKIKFQITLCKNPDIWDIDKMYFSEKECREILRLLTGSKGYQWMKIDAYNQSDEIWFYSKITNVSYQRIKGNIVGFIFEITCNSCFGWSSETIITVNAKANTPFYIFNDTDDLNNYVFPLIQITPTTACDIELTNVTENYVSTIKNVKKSEQITIDSKFQLISSNQTHSLLLNDFNLNWIRLIPNENQYILNVDAIIVFTFRTPRKVGIT